PLSATEDRSRLQSGLRQAARGPVYEVTAWGPKERPRGGDPKHPGRFSEKPEAGGTNQHPPSTERLEVVMRWSSSASFYCSSPTRARTKSPRPFPRFPTVSARF